MFPAGQLGLIGGTGPLGRGLALRLAGAGRPVLVGSRDASRAAAIAGELAAELAGEPRLTGATNREVAERAELVLVTLPYPATRETVLPLVPQLAGKVVVSTAVPLQFRGGVPFPAPVPAGSAALELASYCPDSRVVGAFHTVSAPSLARLQTPLDEDTLITGDDPAAKAAVVELVLLVPGLRPVDAGGLVSSLLTESLTALLLRLNRIHHAHSGVRLTGL
jgi:NADPH-dependent F420 reductase